MERVSTFLFKEIATAISLFFITRFIIHSVLRTKSRKLPPGPNGWPILGALPLLGSMPHVTLAKMAKKYGPIMYLKMGTLDMVVASTPDAARAFLRTLDLNFLTRWATAGAIHLAYNAQDMVFAHYGPRLKLLKKLSNHHLLGSKAIEDWASVRANELGYIVQAMRGLCDRGEPVVVTEMLAYYLVNVSGQVIFSRRLFETKCSKSKEFLAMVIELMTTTGLFNVGDFIPSVAWMDLQGIERGMKKLHKKFDVIITRWMEEHAASSDKRKGKPDFLDMIMANRDYSESERLSSANIKGLLLNIVTAGTDPSSSTIEWALAEMLKNPRILKRAQDEMDRVIGKERRLQESDIPKLPYLRAICKETFRKHPPIPLDLPRISAEACQINGIYIPKNTRLAINIWAIVRDPDVWENPLEFVPERFLSGGAAGRVELLGNDFELIPFGAGRRMCPGARMGVALVEYALGTLVHSFEWKLRSEVDELNMDEAFGLALRKAVPLSALVNPRLAPAAYDASSS